MVRLAKPSREVYSSSVFPTATVSAAGGQSIASGIQVNSVCAYGLRNPLARWFWSHGTRRVIL